MSESETMVAGRHLHDVRPVAAGPMPARGREWTVSVATHPTEIVADWARLEAEGVATLYQRHGFVSAWLETIGAAEGWRPMLVSVRGPAGCAMILPLAVERRIGLRLARFSGGGHANHNLPLFDPALMADVPPATIASWLTEAGAALGLDAFVLERQPVTWDGHANPLASALAATPTPTVAQDVCLADGFEAMLQRHGGASKRRNNRAKEKLLAAHGPVEIASSADPAAAGPILDLFFAQKAERLAQLGIADPFDTPAARAFFHRLLGGGGQSPLLELSWLTAGDSVRAIIGCGAQGGRQSVMILSFAQDTATRGSPGKVLLYRTLERLATRGVAVIDFGVGREGYKDSWADAEFPLVDAHVAVSPRGRLAVGALRARRRLEGLVRDTPAAWAAYKALRRLAGPRRGVKAPAADEDER